MPTSPQPLAHAVYCPVCGYDLRGTPGAKCSECGTEFGKVVQKLSQIPWVHRRHVGRIRAYLHTLWLVLFLPRRLTDDARQRVSLRDARMFHRISVTLATVIGTGLIVVVINLCDYPDLGVGGYSLWLQPALAMTDRWWAVFPLALAIWLAILASLACLRGLMGLGSRGTAGRRLRRLGLYASAIAVVETVLAGLTYGGIAARQWIKEGGGLPGWALTAGPWILTASIALGILAAGAVLWPGTMLVGRNNHLKVERMIMLYVGYPAVLALDMVIIIAVFWLMGHVAMAIRSMTS